MFTPVSLDNYILTRWECTCNVCGNSFLIYNSEWNELADFICSDNVIRFLPLEVPHGYDGFILALGLWGKDWLPKHQVIIDELISSMAPYHVKLQNRRCPVCGKHDYRIISSITEKNMPVPWVELDFELYDSMVNQVPRPNSFEIWKSEYRKTDSSVAEKFCLADFVNKLKQV